MRLLYGEAEQNTKMFFFFFSTLILSFQIQLQKILPPFDKLNETE